VNPKKILVIRRDNIGDLVCTTPALAALRARFPEARIDVLVNDYNAPVLASNPDIDRVWIYRKAKHRAAGESVLGIWLATAAMMWRIRRERYDVAIVATTSVSPSTLKFARHVSAARTIAATRLAGISDPVSLDTSRPLHETEAVMALLQPLGIIAPPGPCKVMPPTVTPQSSTPLIGLHLSARKAKQRWPVENFAELARQLHSRHDARFLLFWAPGTENDPRHPGDDEKTARMLQLTAGLPVEACASHTLPELIAGLARCTHVICSDGGAMHLAAGLGKPIIALFGNSEVARWRPWGVPHVALQKSSLDVRDIQVDEVVATFQCLQADLASTLVPS